MQTYTHFLLAAVLRRHLKKKGSDPGNAFLAGSVAPDVPLTLLSLGYVVDRRYIRPELPDKTRCSPTYNFLYYNNPWWITTYNFVHAPLPIFTYWLIGRWGQKQQKSWGEPLTWFALGLGSHALADVFTHADDGPLLLYPLEWHARFSAPVSYWDEKHGARWFRLVEHLFVALAALFLWLTRDQKTQLNRKRRKGRKENGRRKT